MVDKTEFKITPNDDEEEFAVDFGEVIKVGGGGGTSDFNALTNRPKYNNSTMTGATNIPKVPTTTSELENDADYQTGNEVAGAISEAIEGISIPTKTSELENDGADGTSSYVEADELADVATSGNYSDLSGTPTIPTVNDATLTIMQNGIIKGEFTANDDTDTEIDLDNTTYSDFKGTDGQTAGTAGLVPAPATTDADKFLKSDGTWATAGGGGGGDTVYSDTTTSNSTTGGAVYIGNLNASQQEQPDPTTTDNHYKYYWALPFINTNIPDDKSINIMGSNAKFESVVIGSEANNPIGIDAVAIGDGATVRAQDSVCIGHGSYINNNITNSVALGSRSNPTRVGEVNIGNTIGAGYNYTNYRVLGGVHDGQLAQDAATVAQVNATIDAINTALSTNIPHIGA